VTLQKSKDRLSATSAKVYDKLAIDAALREQLESNATKIHALGRRSTEQTFELGDELDRAAALLPQEGILYKWAEQRCGLKARSARLYMAVFRNLDAYRDDLVDQSVGSTVLFALSSATPEQIKAAIAFADDNKRLQVADVKAILSDGGESDGKADRNDPFSAGGVVGLKALIALKIREGLKALLAHVATICQIILAELAKKRIIKEGLAKQIQDLARVARLELESLALFIDPQFDSSQGARSTSFPTTSEWAGVNTILQKLGVAETWPKSAAMRGWLEAEVLPVLAWAISKERKPAWPLARPEVEAPADLQWDEAVEDDVTDVAVLEIGSAEPEPEVDASTAVPASTGPDDQPDVLLNEAPLGSITIFREGPNVRKQIAEVPPLAIAEFDDSFADEAFDDLSEEPDTETAPAAMV